MTAILPEDLASHITYLPKVPEGPRFHVPEDKHEAMRPYFKGLVRAHPDVLVVPGFDDGEFYTLRAGTAFGPKNDRAVELEICEKFGVRVPDHDVLAPARSPVDVDDPYTVDPAIEPQPPLQRPTGRGRPPKYPFRQMTKVGDHFLAVGATRPKMQQTGCNFLTKSGLRGSLEFAYLRVRRGVLVVVVETTDHTSRYEADAAEEDR